MDQFCIDSCVLGTNKHLLCTNDKFSWCSWVPDDAWHLSGETKLESSRCLDSLLRLVNVTIDLSPPASFVTPMEMLLSSSHAEHHPVPWQHVMPPRVHRAFVKTLVDQVKATFPTLPVGYYSETWEPGNDVLRSLQRAKIDAVGFQRVVGERTGNFYTVETFRPEADGLTEKIVYDRLGTLTGRLTVASGPNILTLKKEHRGLIVPTAPDGFIVSIDFAALEARVLLYEAGRRCEDSDLYNVIAQELGNGTTRSAAKIAVISELYGGGRAMLGEKLHIEGKELDAFVKRVKGFFNTKPLLKRIKKQFIETGLITNCYGRPVKVDEPLDHVLINYYAQSSGVDVAMLGFSQLVRELSVTAPEIRPLFTIHDALVLDVPGKCMPIVNSIKQVKVKGFVQSFPVKVECIGCTP